MFSFPSPPKQAIRNPYIYIYRRPRVKKRLSRIVTRRGGKKRNSHKSPARSLTWFIQVQIPPRISHSAATESPRPVSSRPPSPKRACEIKISGTRGKQRLISPVSQMEIVPVASPSITGSKTPGLASLQVRRWKRSEINLISCAISSCRHRATATARGRRRRRRPFLLAYP